MATIKHIASKKIDYASSELRMRFVCNQKSGKPVLDENGCLIPRKDILYTTIGCGEEDFAISCLKANARFGKNSEKDEIKAHHYIIAFDPRDVTENGLTMKKAMELGMEFYMKNLRGHQALLCASQKRRDGQIRIFVHIMINSLRVIPGPYQDYMDRRCDTLAGCKHRCTAGAFWHFRNDVMEICKREGLHQIDLISAERKEERAHAGKTTDAGYER